jgi:hypothetical protein
LIWNTIVWVLHDPAATGLTLGFLVLMLWGSHGKLELLGLVWKDWAPFTLRPPELKPVLDAFPWDQEWISFWAGAVLVVGIPGVLIRFRFKQHLSDYGLGLPVPGRWRLTLLSAVVLFGVSLLAFIFGAGNPGMRCTYPLYRGGFQDNGQFFLYEVGYFPFFLAIEFIFRGFLLFGLFRAWQVRKRTGKSHPRGFGYYAILLSMLSYTAWHLGKPIPELWGTLVWGLATGTIALATGTIWPIIGVHWVLNVILDWRIWHMLPLQCP